MSVRVVTALAWLAVSIGGPAAVGQVLIVRPSVIEAPTDIELASAVPPKAASEGVQGVAWVQCVAQLSGDLRDCKVTNEEPLGYDFGKAALALVPRYKVSPARTQGSRSDAITTIIVEFPCPNDCKEPIRAANSDTSLVYPRLVRSPSSDELFKAWPPAARASGIGGAVTLECLVTVNGTLDACKIATPQAEGSGFGAAALSVAPYFRYEPARRNGETVPAITQARVEFRCLDRCMALAVPNGFAGTIVSNLGWRETPSLSDVKAAYPRAAAADGVRGQATLFCTFRSDSRLRNCRVMSESPEGRGFGRAAQQLSRQFVGLERIDSGRSIEGAGVQIVIAFEPDPKPGSPALARAPSEGEMIAAYPVEAMRAGVNSGRATLSCVVGDGGALTNCRTLGEAPRDLGFSAAVASLAPTFVAGMWAEEGLPTLGSTINVPVRLQRIDPESLRDLAETRPADAVRVPVLTSPEWRRKPAPGDINRVFPVRALRLERSGAATISCLVNVDGTLRDCTIVSEQPLGLDFGAAAMSLVPLFQLTPETRDGQAVTGARVNIPIVFRID